MDEVSAIEQIGYSCITSVYGRNDQKENKVKKIWGTIRNAFQLTSKLKSANTDVLYLNSRFEPVGSIRDFITIFILKTFYRKTPKIIIKSHGSDCSILEPSAPFLYRKVIVPFLTKNVDSWIFLSQEEKDFIKKHHPFMAKRVAVLPNIIVSERCRSSVDFKIKYDLPENKFTCLFVGRLVKVKGIFDLLDSIPLIQSPENFHFVFVGDGPDADDLKRKAESINSKIQISFKGFIPEAECDQFFTCADVLVYPTYDTEGFCMAIFKSIACGLPVITTRIRAAKDYLSEPDNVLWIQKESPKEIASALNRIFNDQIMRTQMTRNNLELGKVFSPHHVATQMERVLFETDKKQPVLG